MYLVIISCPVFWSVTTSRSLLVFHDFHSLKHYWKKIQKCLRLAFVVVSLCLDWGYRCLERKQWKYILPFLSHHIKDTVIHMTSLLMFIFITWLRQYFSRFSTVKLTVFPFLVLFLGNESLSLAHSQGKKVCEAKGGRIKLHLL